MDVKKKDVIVTGLALVVGGWLWVAIAQQPPIAQEAPIEREDRIRARVMLEDIEKRLRKEYYDPSFHGVDIEARFQEAKARIEKATSINQALGTIAWALDPLDDWHTTFLPPPRPYRHDYGWRMQMIGNKCYVTAVKPGSDAERQGLKQGDEIESANGLVPTRETLPKMQYLFNVLRPQPGLVLAVRSPDGRRRTLEILAEFQTEKLTLRDPMDFWNEIRDSESRWHLWRDRFYEPGPDVLIWKMPSFVLDSKAVDSRVRKAREFKTLILDLRGNPGGREDALLRMIGNFFDHEVKLGDEKGRRETKPLLAKSRGEEAFQGKLIVLVDGSSASAAELFARVVQLEKRGTVIGDKTRGAVMASRIYPDRVGLERVVFYAVSITVSDLIMTDGNSLEHVGVTPDETLLPSAADLANQRDPVLARAALLAGVELTPEQAGTLFPIEWLKR